MFGIRKRLKKLRKRTLDVAYSRIAARLGRSPLVQRIVGSRPVRLTVAVLVFVWYRILVGLIWRPIKRALDWTHRFLQRHEILGWIITVGLSIVMGKMLTTYFLFFKLFAGGVCLAGYAIITLRNPQVGLFIWLISSPIISNFLRLKIMPGFPVVTADRLCMVVLLVALLLQAKRTVKLPKLPMLNLSMFLFIAAMLLATVPSPNPKHAAQTVLDSYGVPMLVYVCAMHWIREPRDLRKVFVALMVVALYMTAFGIPEYFTHHNVFRTYGNAWQDLELGVVRVQGPAASPQEYGLVVGLGWFLLTVHSAFAKRKAGRAWHWCLLGAMGLAIWYTLRRSVYLGCALGLVVMILSSKDVRRSLGPLLLAGVVVALIFWQAIMAHPIVQGRVASVKEMYPRAILYTSSIAMAKEHPWLGVGVNNFGTEIRRHLRPYKDIMPWYAGSLISPHNSYLRVIVDGGLVSFLPFIAMLLGTLAYSVIAYLRAPPGGVQGKGFVLAFWALAVAHLSQAATTDMFWYGPYLSALYFFMFGSLAGVFLRTDVDVAAAVEPADGTRLPLRKARRTLPPLPKHKFSNEQHTGTAS